MRSWPCGTCDHPVYGVQFHPESVLTEHGYRMLDHFLHGIPSVPRALPADRRRACSLAALRGEQRSPGLGSAARGPGPVIIETIVTSIAPDGTINFAPMGVEWGEDDASC